MRANCSTQPIHQGVVGMFFSRSSSSPPLSLPPPALLPSFHPMKYSKFPKSFCIDFQYFSALMEVDCGTGHREKIRGGLLE